MYNMLNCIDNTTHDSSVIHPLMLNSTTLINCMLVANSQSQQMGSVHGQSWHRYVSSDETYMQMASFFANSDFFCHFFFVASQSAGSKILKYRAQKQKWTSNFFVEFQFFCVSFLVNLKCCIVLFQQIHRAYFYYLDILAEVLKRGMQRFAYCFIPPPPENKSSSHSN